MKDMRDATNKLHAHTQKVKKQEKSKNTKN